MGLVGIHVLAAWLEMLSLQIHTRRDASTAPKDTRVVYLVSEPAKPETCSWIFPGVVNHTPP